MTLRDQLVALIRGFDLEMDADLRDDTALISSGLFDSQALFGLMLWVEEQTGGTIDPASLDLVQEWNTIADVVAFVEGRCRT